MAGTKTWVLKLSRPIDGDEKHVGRPERLPQRPLLWTNHPIEALENIRPLGRGPSKLLYDTSSVDRLIIFVKEGRMFPLNWFRDRFRSSNISNFPSCCGKTPLNLLLLTSNMICKLAKFPIVSGKSPLKLLVLIFNNCSLMHLPSSSGTDPLKIFLDISR